MSERKRLLGKKQNEKAAPRYTLPRTTNSATDKKGRSCFDKILIVIAILASVISGFDALGLAILNGYSNQLFATLLNNATSDEIIVQHFEYNAVLVIWGHIILIVGVFVSSYIQIVLWGYLAEKRLSSAGQNAFRVLLQQPISWWDQNHSGQINQDVQAQLSLVRAGLGEKIGALIQMSTWMVNISVLILVVKWWLIFVAILVALAAFSGTMFIRKHSGGYRKQAMQHRRKSTHIASEILQNMRTVHAYNAQDFELTRFEKCQQAVTKQLLRAHAGMAALFGWLELWAYIAFVPPLLFTYQDVINGDLSVAIYLALTVSFARLAVACEHFSGMYSEVRDAFRAVKLLENYESKVGTSIVALPENAPARSNLGEHEEIQSIVFRDVSFAYPSQPSSKILSKVNFQLRKNETVAVIGETGSGKSTIINLLLTFYDDYKGQIVINDELELNQISARSWRSKVGVVSQQCVLLDMSVIDNIRAGRDEIDRQQIAEACRQSNAEEFILELPQGYDTVIKGEQLSGGQQQRLALARALVGSPEVLILDEPTASLDSQNEQLVEQAIQKAKKGRATLLISHTLRLTEDANLILVLNKGIIVEAGTYNELIEANNTFAQMADQQDAGADKSRRQSSASSTGKPAPPVFWQDSKTKPSARNSKDEQDTSMNKVTLPRAKIVLCSILACIGGLSLPLRGLLAFLAYSSLVNGLTTQIHEVIWGALGTGIFSCIAVTAMAYAFMYVSEKLAAKTRKQTMRQILTLPIPALDKEQFNSSRLLQLLFDLVDSVKIGIDWHLGKLMASFFGLILSIIVVVVLEWRLIPIAILGLPILGAGHYFSYKLSKIKGNCDDSKPDQLLYEAIRKIRTVRFLNLGNNFLERYQVYMEEHAGSSLRQSLLIGGLCTAYAKIAVIFYLLISFTYCAWATIRLELNPLVVVFVRVLIGFTCTSLGITVFYLQNFNKAKSSWQQLKRFIGIDTSSSNPMIGGSKLNVDGSLRIDSVEFQYSEGIRVLKGIKFETKAGHLTVIVGRSGSGKSTLLQLIERFYDPTAGSVIMSNRDVREHNLHHLRSKMAWLSQNPVLFDSSVADNIKYGSDDDDFEFLENCSQLACAHDFIVGTTAGYQTTAGEQGLRFSGGQRQRIALARALYRKPKLLLLDEATSALDVNTEHVGPIPTHDLHSFITFIYFIQAILANLRASKYSTVLVTHRLAAAEIADLLVVMKRGRLVQIGTHEQLSQTDGYYQQLCAGSYLSDIATDLDNE